MVQRKGLKKAAVGNKSKRGTYEDEERLSKRKLGGRRTQKKGELDLENPFIPADLDEDIDDDLAFNSDDEAKYGQFFGNSGNDATQPKKKTKKAKGSSNLDGEFDRLQAVDGAGDDDEVAFSDDSREEFDLSEMLDSKDDRRKAKVARRNKREGRKSTPGEKLTREQETILGPTDDTSDAIVRKAAGLHDLLQSATDTPSTHRLESALRNKKNLLTDDVDELTKDRVGRAKTREVVANNLKKYTTVLKVHKEAPHLKFPLAAPDANPVPGTMGSLATALSNQHRGASSSMESKMHDLLRASGLGGIRATAPPPSSARGAEADGNVKFGEGEDDEDDNAQRGVREKISVGYMAKLKSMLGYEISKRKRLNKIKSKTYRRILRKEKDREQERRQKALELLNPEAARTRLREKMEKMRAEERITQKHKNTSKWVKHAKQFSKFDSDTKDAIDEQHSLHQKLMAKMSEEAGAEIADAADDVSESSEEEMRVDELLAGQKSAESILWQGADAAAEKVDMTPTEKARHELMGMGFMTKAKDRSKAQLQSELADLKEDIARYHQGQDPLYAPKGFLAKGQRKARAMMEDDDNAIVKDVQAEDEEDVAQATGRKVTRQGGAHGDAAKATKGMSSTGSVSKKGAGRKAVAEARAHLAHEVTLQKRKGIRVDNAETGLDPIVSEGCANEEGDIDMDRTEEVWDADTADAQRTPKGTNVAVDDTLTFAGARSAKKVSQTTRVRVLPTAAESRPKRAREERPGADVKEEQPADAERQQEEERRDVQQYLIARAFAMDDVDAEFLKAKEAQVESIMKPEDKNASLPGWGEWGGEDNNLNNEHQKRVDAAKLARRIQMTSLMKARADAQLDNVIINHDVDIVPDRHTLHMVPRPFSNPTEFSRSMRQPLGPEWNSSLTFKEGTQPRITTTQGVAIDPLDLTAQKKKAKTVRRKLANKQRGSVSSGRPQ